MNEEKKSEEKSISIALCIGMGVFIVLTGLIALMLATPFEVSDIKAFQNPESMWNPLYFFLLIICFTALILIVLRFGGKRLVYFVMLAAVAVTIYYVMDVLIPYKHIPLVSTLGLTLLLYKYPEWYVLDATGLIIGGGAAAIFGISLGILPVLLLMIILAVYDAIAVYKTKHMVSLAESIVDLRIPVLFVLPRTRNFSLLRDKDQEEGKSEMEEAFFMGLGDAIIPSMLVVSANCMPAFAYYWGLINAPALGALIGTLAGYAVLSRIAGRGKPHAGLPFLNSGAIIGFVIGYMFMVV
ncbi:MAG: hypothetical protein KAU16_01445 [Methanophagales archaeon]|nr:hypothetical protein [Methanophagales archaeon]